MVYFQSERYSKEEQKSAYAKLRESKKEKKAWEEDNEKRRQEEKPTRTLAEYRADNSPSPPLPSPPQPSAREKPFDPREPRSDRLPKMKIPRARTQEEKNGIRRAQEQLGHPRRSGSFSSSSRTAAAAGKKRTADDQGDSVNKKPKNGADKAIAATKPRADHQRPYVPKKPDIGASTSRSLKRHSDDQSSSSPKRSKGGSFMDYLPKNDSKAATTGESKGEPKAPSSVTNHTEGGQGGAATESRKIKPAVSNAKRSADKKNATGTSSKPLTGANKSGIAGDGEAGEQEVGGTQESLTNAVANATTRADKEATTGELPKPQSETEPPNASLATANPVDHAGPGEQDSKPGRVDTPAQESSAARSKDSDPGAKDEPKPDHLPLEGSASMASGAALADGEVAASALSDGNKTSKNVTGSDSTITSPGNKRKRDSEITSPAKKSKVRHSNPRNSVGNYRQGCFINASAHALHSVPALASLRNETSDAIAADNILSDAETKLAGTGGRSRTKEELRAKLRDHLRSKADRNELKVSPHFNEMMTQLSADQGEALKINPFVFQQVCGTMFTGNEDQPMNGETQEDAHEFIMKLLHQIQKEQPELDIRKLFATQFAEQQVCRCDTPKMFSEEANSFHIPEFMQPRGPKSSLRTITFGDLIKAYTKDASKFADYRCEKCGEVGKYSRKDGWEGKRMTQSPEYLIANVPRGQVRYWGDGTEKIKLMNDIEPPLKKIHFPSVDGGDINYHMVAMIRHQGTNLHKGHYTTIRKIGNEWFHCDDTAKGGITGLSRAAVHDYGDGCVFLLKKSSAEDLDEEL